MKLSPAEKDRLMKAYDEHVQRHGRGSAVEAVELGSGQMFVTHVTSDALAATLAVLAKPPLVAQGKASLRLSRRDRSMSVQDTLAGMAKSIYERR